MLCERTTSPPALATAPPATPRPLPLGQCHSAESAREWCPRPRRYAGSSTGTSLTTSPVLTWQELAEQKRRLRNRKERERYARDGRYGNSRPPTGRKRGRPPNSSYAAAELQQQERLLQKDRGFDDQRPRRFMIAMSAPQHAPAPAPWPAPVAPPQAPEPQAQRYLSAATAALCQKETCWACGRRSTDGRVDLDDPERTWYCGPCWLCYSCWLT